MTDWESASADEIMADIRAFKKHLEENPPDRVVSMELSLDVILDLKLYMDEWFTSAPPIYAGLASIPIIEVEGTRVCRAIYASGKIEELER